MAGREREGACAGGHVTGCFAGGSREELDRARQTECFSRLTNLAKLNPKCHYELFGLFVTEMDSMCKMGILKKLISPKKAVDLAARSPIFVRDTLPRY